VNCSTLPPFLEDRYRVEHHCESDDVVDHRDDLAMVSANCFTVADVFAIWSINRSCRHAAAASHHGA
jgi:hypothetical protein